MKPSQEVTPSLRLDLEVSAQVPPSLSDHASLEVVAEQLRTRMLSLPAAAACLKYSRGYRQDLVTPESLQGWE